MKENRENFLGCMYKCTWQKGTRDDKLKPEDTMFAIAPTDIDWFTFLRNESILHNVNFWTPTDWKIRKMSSGDRLSSCSRVQFEK